VPDSVVIGLVEERLQRPTPRRLHSRRLSAHGRPGGGARSAAQNAVGSPRSQSSKSTFRGPFDGARHAPPHGQTDWTNLPPQVQSAPPDAELEHRADDQEETVKKRLDDTTRMTRLSPALRKLGFCAGSTGSDSRKSHGRMLPAARLSRRRLRRHERRNS
jgi:adenylate kinase family enzyme